MVELTYRAGRKGTEPGRMDVDLTIRYSDDRLCEVVVCRPNNDTALYPIGARARGPRREPHRSHAGSPPPLRDHALARSASPPRRLNPCEEFSGTGVAIVRAAVRVSKNS